MKKYVIILLVIYVICYIALSISGQSWNPIDWSGKVSEASMVVLFGAPFVAFFIKYIVIEVL